MANILTFNQVIDVLQDIAQRHYQINTFYLGRDWELENDNDIVYPVLQVYPEFARMPQTNGDFKTLNVRLICKVVDLVNQNESNEKDVHSDTLRIAQDIVNEINQHPYYQRSNANIIGDIDFTNLEEYEDDFAGGWEFTLNLQLINNNSYCGLPFEELPGYSASGPVSSGYSYSVQYLTCSTLTACTTFQDYVADAIDNIPTSTDVKVTGFTYNNSNQFTIFNDDGSFYPTTINTVTGLTTNYFDFNIGATPTLQPGRIAWNDVDGTLDLRLKGDNVTLQLGQEQLIRVVNKTDSNLLESEYKVTRVRTQAEGGAQGQRLAVVLAQADNKANHSGVLGLVTENITKNQEGFIATFGNVRDINTTGSLQGETWLDGDILWLSETSAGVLTNIQPQNHPIQIGYVVYAHNNQGKIFVKVEEGVDELNELHDVNISGNTGGSILEYNASTSLWVNSPIVWTIELVDAQTVDVYAPYNMEINSISNILNSPSITLFDDDVVYTLGNSIAVGSKITVSASTTSVVNLNISK